VFVRNREQLAAPPVGLALDESAVEQSRSWSAIGRRLSRSHPEAAAHKKSRLTPQNFPFSGHRLPVTFV
jgi:hypothetical protein